MIAPLHAVHPAPLELSRPPSSMQFPASEGVQQAAEIYDDGDATSQQQRYPQPRRIPFLPGGDDASPPTKTKRGIIVERGDEAAPGPDIVRPAAPVAVDPSSPTSPAEGLYLAALRIFLLGEAHSSTGSHWLESNKDLSVVSRHTCEECRQAARFHVWVNKETPRSLWAVSVSSGYARQCPAEEVPTGIRMNAAITQTRTRVPEVRVVKVTWQMTSSGVLGQTSAAAKGLTVSSLRDDVREIVFGDIFNEPLKGLVWPRSLSRLTFGSSFNQPLFEVHWPPDLRELTFGRSFNQAMSGVMLPGRLESLTFGCAFARSCSEITWPDSLRHITFGHDFDEPISSMIWPHSLEQLTFGRKFNQPNDGVGAWPRSLKKLVFGWYFDQKLDQVVFPGTLEILSIAGVYNRPLDGIRLPQGLRKLTLGGHFNQPVHTIQWPQSLEEVSFGWAFDQPLAEVGWPRSVVILSLGYRFNQSVENIRWPPALEHLDLGVFSRQSLEGLTWPESFRLLTVSRAFDLTGLVLPTDARVCRRGHTYCKVQRGIKRWYNAITAL